jgi:hypothetical protein
VKQCIVCRKYKENNKYYYISQTKKLMNSCKECKKFYEKQYHKKYPWNICWNLINQRCNNKNNTDYYKYGKKGIKCLITKEEIKIIWMRDKASNLKRPSIDRIDNDGNYEYSNCRFIEQPENSCRNKRHIIMQYSFDGKFIKQYESQTTAAKMINGGQTGISRVVDKDGLTAYGYIWRNA